MENYTEYDLNWIEELVNFGFELSEAMLIVDAANEQSEVA